MKRVYLILFLLGAGYVSFSQGKAGPDKTVSDHGTKIGTPGDPKLCYHWEAIPADPSLKDISSPQPEVFPTQTTVYKLTITGAEFASRVVDEVTVFKFGIEYFRHSAGKEWKVVVGESIEFSAFASADCTDWEWDMDDGFPDKWNPTGGNVQKGNSMVIPYDDLSGAENGWFGDTYGTVTVSCKDAEGNVHTFSSTQMTTPQKAKVFFDPVKNIDGGTPSDSKPPCWFLFWREGAVPGLEDFEYVHDNLWGESEVRDFVIINIHILKVGILAGLVHYPNGLLVNGVEYGGATGIDCCAETVRHEKRHNELAVELIDGSPDNDPPNAIVNAIGDWLPDVHEASLSCSPLNKDTHNIAGLKGSNYARYGDNEYAALVAGYGIKGVAAKDWSKGGKQW